MKKSTPPPEKATTAGEGSGKGRSSLPSGSGDADQCAAAPREAGPQRGQTDEASQRPEDLLERIRGAVSSGDYLSVHLLQMEMKLKKEFTIVSVTYETEVKDGMKIQGTEPDSLLTAAEVGR